MKKVTARAIGEMNEDEVAASITELACEHGQKKETGRRRLRGFSNAMLIDLVAKLMGQQVNPLLKISSIVLQVPLPQ